MEIAVLVRSDAPGRGHPGAPLRLLRADRMRRAVIVVDLTVDGRPVSVVGTHMSHIVYGSPHNFAELGQRLRTEARPDAVLAGDMNAWGPFVPTVHARRLAAGRARPELAGLASRTARSTTSWCAARCGPLRGAVLPRRRLGPPAPPRRADVGMTGPGPTG